MEENSIAFVDAQLLIRKPVHEVFTAFIDPKHTTQFRFRKSDGQLEVGKQVV